MRGYKSKLLPAVRSAAVVYAMYLHRAGTNRLQLLAGVRSAAIVVRSIAPGLKD